MDHSIFLIHMPLDYLLMLYNNFHMDTEYNCLLMPHYMFMLNMLFHMIRLYNIFMLDMINNYLLNYNNSYVLPLLSLPHN